MEKDNYTISITGKQAYDGESGEIALNTTGSYTQQGQSQLITYTEYDEDNPKISYTSMLKVEKDKVTMMRDGGDTRLILEKGKRHLCLYDTGFGTMTVGVFTSEFSSSLNPSGGALNIKYTLDIDSNLSSKNEIKVEVKPRKAESLN